MLLNDEVQVGLVRGVDHPDIKTVDLMEDELILVANAGHELVGKGPVSVEQLGQYPFIFFDRNSSYYALAQDMFRKSGVVPRGHMELDSTEATKRMVEAGLGIALLPRIALDRELGAGSLQRLDIDDVPNSSRQIALISRRDRRFGPAAQAFVDLVVETYKASSTR